MQATTEPWRRSIYLYFFCFYTAWTQSGRLKGKRGLSCPINLQREDMAMPLQGKSRDRTKCNNGRPMACKENNKSLRELL